MAENASFRFPAATGMPLHALSPERVNKQSSKVIMMQSPTTVSELGRSNFLANSQFSKQNEQSTLSSNPGSPNRQENCSPMAHIDVSGFSPPKHWRTNSDVQNIVARFNSLDIRDASEERRKRDAAALKRAQMGREEAEAEVKKLKEDQRTAKSELEESKDRERRVMKRLDVVMVSLRAHTQSTDGGLTDCRRICIDPRRRKRMLSRYTRKRFGELGKRHSRPLQQWSSCRKSSNQPETH